MTHRRGYRLTLGYARTVRKPSWEETSLVVAFALAGAAFLLHGVVVGVVLLAIAFALGCVLWTPLRSYLGVPTSDRERSISPSGVAPFAAETSGLFSMSRVLTKPWDLKPDDFCFITISDLRITNRQTDKSLSVDVRLHLPIKLSGTSQPLRERTFKDTVPVPDGFMPDHPLSCPIRVAPGETVSGDVSFLMRGTHYFANYSDDDDRVLAGGEIVEILDYVSDTTVKLRIGDRVPVAPKTLDA